MDIFVPNERELIHCPITGQVKIGKNLNFYGASGGAAGGRVGLHKNEFKKRLGENAFSFNASEKSQNRLKVFMQSYGFTQPRDFVEDGIPLLKYVKQKINDFNEKINRT